MCRNEDILLPEILEEVQQVDFENDAESYSGYELVFEKNEKSFLVGYNRLTNEAMYGWLKIVGSPVKYF